MVNPFMLDVEICHKMYISVVVTIRKRIQPTADKIRKPAIYGAIRPSKTTPPPQMMLSGFYHSTTGYRVVRPHGAGSWLLFFTVAGTGLLRQPHLELRQEPGDVALLAPDAYSDYGVLPRSGEAITPLVSAAAAERYARFVPVDRRQLRADPTRRFTRCLHLDPRRPWPDARRGWRFHWIHFQPRVSWGELSRWMKLAKSGVGLYSGRITDPRRSARIESAFERIHRDLLSGGPSSEPLATTALEEVLLLVGNESRGRPLDPRIAAALGSIQSDLAARHSVESLARAAALSPSRFAHLFKEETGSSVAQTVIRLRIMQARRMLTYTQERISDIAYALGFCSPYYFSQQFKAEAGLSPQRFRTGLVRRRNGAES
jgi:AraC family transcriptional regulator of arabinose operon